MSITDLIPWKRGEKKVPVKQQEEPSFDLLQRDINRWFDEAFKGFGLVPAWEWGEGWDVFNPKVDFVESRKELKVSVELPGMDEKDIDITLSPAALTISGEKKSEHEDKGDNYYRMERSYGTFRRTIPLSCEVNADKVDAVFKNGVLTIVLPKTKEARACRQIPIKQD